MRLFLLLGTSLTVACEHHENVQCVNSSDCNLATGGICLTTPPDGRLWCAYPDAACTSGYQYSNDDVGDGVGGTCVGVTPNTITVTLGGNGTGRVTSLPAGIDCPGSCSASFPKGATVTLSPSSANAVFLGWSDDCKSDCMITLDTDKHLDARFAIPGSNIWSSQLHGSMYGSIDAAKALSNNDIVIVGTFIGNVMFGGAQLTSQNNGSAFAARLRASDGSVVWVTRFDASAKMIMNHVDSDANDDIFVAGLYDGTAVFNGTSTTGGGITDVVVAKLAGATGDYKWAHTFGNSGYDLVAGIAVDRSGDVSLTGYFSGGAISPGPSPLTGTNATYVVKYKGSTGAHVWSRALNSSDTLYGDFPNGLAVDANGNVLIVGGFEGTINFGGGSVTSTGGEFAFLVKFAAENGAYILSKAFPSYVASVASDSDNNVYVLGRFSGSLPITTPSLASAGGLDVFVAKYSAAGAIQWARSLGNNLSDTPIQLTVDQASQLMLSATFQGTVSYGGPTFVALGDTDLIFARLRSQDGAHLGSIQLGGIGGEQASIIGCAGGTAFITGWFRGTTDFGGKTFTSPNSTSDGFELLVAPLNR